VNLFKDQSGRFKPDFNIGGTTDNPKVQLDTDPAKKRAEDLAKQKLDEQKKKLEDQLKPELLTRLRSSSRIELLASHTAALPGSLLTYL